MCYLKFHISYNYRLYLFANILTYEDSFLLPCFIGHLCGVAFRTAARCCWVGFAVYLYQNGCVAGGIIVLGVFVGL